MPDSPLLMVVRRVILLDMMTERIDGPMFMSHLREIPTVAPTPVIAAMSTSAVRERYGDRRLSVADTVLAPITQASLTEVLEQYR